MRETIRPFVRPPPGTAQAGRGRGLGQVELGRVDHWMGRSGFQPDAVFSTRRRDPCYRSYRPGLPTYPQGAHHAGCRRGRSVFSRPSPLTPICASLSIWRTGQTSLEGPAERHPLLFAGGGRLAREHHAARGWGSVRERHTRAGLPAAAGPAPPMLSAAPKLARMPLTPAVPPVRPSAPPWVGHGGANSRSGRSLDG